MLKQARDAKASGGAANKDIPKQRWDVKVASEAVYEGALQPRKERVSGDAASSDSLQQLRDAKASSGAAEKGILQQQGNVEAPSDVASKAFCST